MTTHVTGGKTHEFGAADRLRVAREDAGLDQAQLAEITGISRATISNYERGATTRLKRAYVNQWALATGFDRDWLLTGIATHNPHGPDGGSTSVTDEYRRLHHSKVTRVTPFKPLTLLGVAAA